MSALQTHPHQFLDSLLHWASESGHCTPDIRSSLQNDIEKGVTQLFHSLYPRRVCTSLQIERILSVVRLVSSYGLYLASTGSLPIAWEILQEQKIFPFSRQGASYFQPYFLRHHIAQHPAPATAWLRLHRESSLLSVYQDLAFNSVAPDRYWLRVFAQSEDSEVAYCIAEAAFQILQVHKVQGLENDLLTTIPLDQQELMSQVLLHRLRTGYPVRGKANVDTAENLRFLLDWGKKPFPFNDPEWQRVHLPEGKSPEIRAKLVASAALLPVEAIEDKETLSMILEAWSGIGFPNQSNISILEKILDDRTEGSRIVEEWQKEEQLGPVLLGISLGDTDPRFPDTGKEKRELLQRLRDQQPDWEYAKTWLRNQPVFLEDQINLILSWMDGTLIPESLQMQSRLQRYTIESPGSAAAKRYFDQGVLWLLEMHVPY